MTKKVMRSGDDGFTDLQGEGRILKSDLRIETLGSIDEASAALGMARANCRDFCVCELLEKIQRVLYQIMAEVAATSQNAEKFRTVDEVVVRWLEDEIDRLHKNREPLHGFIIPGDTPYSAALDLARTIVRRAERRCVELAVSGELTNLEVIKFINRLSTLIFELELDEIRSSGKMGPTPAKK